MASNKDILNAQRYNRRRLVAAFTSGAPGGRDVETRSPVGPLIGGAVLGAIVVAVAAVMGFMAPQLPDGWQNGWLLIESGTGTRYYTIDGTLYPITNVTSARLLADNFQYKEIDAAKLADEPRGRQIGLPDAPDNVPAASDLRSSQWSSCAVAGGIHTWIGEQPPGMRPATIAQVNVGDTYYLIDGGTRFRIDDPIYVRDALGIAETSTAVSNSWLSLFAQGSDLRQLTVKGERHKLGLSGALAPAEVGSVIDLATQDSTHNYWVITSATTRQQISELAFELLRKQDNPDAIRVSAADAGRFTPSAAGLSVPADWPDLIDPAAVATATPCATLVAAQDGLTTALATIPAQPADPSAADETVYTAGVTVAGGSGALVRDLGVGAVRLIGDTGLAYGLGDDPTDSLKRLGYEGVQPAVLDGAWLRLIPEGSSLTNAAAKETIQ